MKLNISLLLCCVHLKLHWNFMHIFAAKLVFLSTNESYEPSNKKLSIVLLVVVDSHRYFLGHVDVVLYVWIYLLLMDFVVSHLYYWVCGQMDGVLHSWLALLRQCALKAMVYVELLWCLISPATDQNRYWTKILCLALKGAFYVM